MPDFLKELLLPVDNLKRFIIPTIFYLIFALCQIPKLKTKQGWRGLFGCLGVGLLSGTIGWFMPPVWWPWFHLLIVPWLITPLPIVAVVLAVVAWAKYSNTRKKEKANDSLN